MGRCRDIRRGGARTARGGWGLFRGHWGAGRRGCREGEREPWSGGFPDGLEMVEGVVHFGGVATTYLRCGRGPPLLFLMDPRGGSVRDDPVGADLKVDTDVHRLEWLLQAHREACARDQPPTQRRIRLEEAWALCRGDFLEGEMGGPWGTTSLYQRIRSGTWLQSRAR